MSWLGRLDQSVADALSDLISKGATERDIVVVFLMILSDSDYGKEFSRHVKRLIRLAEKQAVSDLSLKQTIREIVEG